MFLLHCRIDGCLEHLVNSQATSKEVSPGELKEVGIFKVSLSSVESCMNFPSTMRKMFSHHTAIAMETNPFRYAEKDEVVVRNVCKAFC